MAPGLDFQNREHPPHFFSFSLSLFNPLSFSPMSSIFKNKYGKSNEESHPHLHWDPGGRREAEDAEVCRRPPGAVQLWEDAYCVAKAEPGRDHAGTETGSVQSRGRGAPVLCSL